MINVSDLVKSKKNQEDYISSEHENSVSQKPADDLQKFTLQRFLLPIQGSVLSVEAKKYESNSREKIKQMS